jgi:hypothetical protein
VAVAVDAAVSTSQEASNATTQLSSSDGHASRPSRLHSLVDSLFAWPQQQPPPLDEVRTHGTMWCGGLWHASTRRPAHNPSPANNPHRLAEERRRCSLRKRGVWAVGRAQRQAGSCDLAVTVSHQGDADGWSVRTELQAAQVRHRRARMGCGADRIGGI